jgi:hypothetical protein
MSAGNRIPDIRGNLCDDPDEARLTFAVPILMDKNYANWFRPDNNDD